MSPKERETGKGTVGFRNVSALFSRHLLFALMLNKGRLGDTSSNLAGLSFKVPKGRELGRGERGGGGMRTEWKERDSGERTDPMHTALLWLKIFW